MNHHATPRFWACYRDLPPEVQSLADKAFELAKENPKHPSIHLKKVGRFWSARVGLHHRAVAVEVDEIPQRLEAAEIPYRSEVRGPTDRKVNTAFGGRMIYWNEPEGHQWEMLTVSYARIDRALDGPAAIRSRRRNDAA